MATTHGAQDYVLGSSAREQERLQMQAGIVNGWTRQYLLSAGLAPGMRVLDLGCGMGDVTLLAAEIVRPSGSVTGIDRDGSVIEKARQRAVAGEHGETVAFECANLLDYHASQKFDAVVGRYVLLYQPDPAAALHQIAKQVGSGGILCFHEMILALLPICYPETPLYGRMGHLMRETFHRAGVNLDMGLQLAKSFLDAGLPRPTIKGDIPVGGEDGSYVFSWTAGTVRSLLPKMVQFGLASADEIDIDTLAQRMEDEAVALHSQILGPLQFGAWTKKI
jgi:ubiquinone/menaquinone biosynthesis C-methylase UbiE